MNTFTWLLLGHFVGDWILQNDWMAKGKKKGLLNPAGMAHYAIYTAAIICALKIPGALDEGWMPYLVPGLMVFVSHWLIDATDGVDRWMRLYRQTHLEIVRLMVDQTLHLLVLVVLVEFIRVN